MILLYDNYDSFTYNLYDYIKQSGVECEVVRNDESDVEGLLKLNFEGLVLSPGPGRPKDSGNMMELIEAVYRQVPILGICLGHQAIGEFFGAELQKAILPMHGKTSLIKHTDHAMFTGIPEEFLVMRYHSLVLKNIPDMLEATAVDERGELMAMTHSRLRIWGMQFHPESILTEFGLVLINNWLDRVRNSKP